MKTLREYIDQLDEISRRDFLKGAGASAAAIALSKQDDASAFFGTKGCEKYASKFSCDYVENKAPFDVYLWVPKRIADALRIRGLDTGQGYIEVLVDRTIGLKSVRDAAIYKYRQIFDIASRNLKEFDNNTWPWWERGYIGMLKGKNGENLEKHRML